MMRLPCHHLLLLSLVLWIWRASSPSFSPFPHPCRRVSELKSSAAFPPRGVREAGTRAHRESFFVFLLPITQHSTMSSGVVLFNQRPLSGEQLGGGCPSPARPCWGRWIGVQRRRFNLHGS
ncbi:unnamed protein product [Ectocarpus sp. 12 AP-2014]